MANEFLRTPAAVSLCWWRFFSFLALCSSSRLRKWEIVVFTRLPQIEFFLAPSRASQTTESLVDPNLNDITDNNRTDWAVNEDLDFEFIHSWSHAQSTATSSDESETTTEKLFNYVFGSGSGDPFCFQIENYIWPFQWRYKSNDAKSRDKDPKWNRKWSINSKYNLIEQDAAAVRV